MEANEIWATTQDWLNLKGMKLALVVLSTILALVMARIVAGRLTRTYKRKHTDRELQKRAETLGAMFRYVLNIGVLLMAAMFILDLVGVKLGPMLAAAGVIGIAVGFGVQHVVQDITNGFLIMLDDEIREGV